MVVLIGASQFSVSAIAIGGFVGAIYGIKLTIGPAILLGGLLWFLRVRSAWIWIGAGALGGLGGYGFLSLADAGETFTAANALPLIAASLAAGISGALIFRLMMDTLTAFQDDGYDYD